MYPILVEPEIKYVLNNHLNTLKQINENKKNILFNVLLFLVLVTIIGVTLKLKYKGKQDIQLQRIKENQKKDYILTNLRKYQNMKHPIN
jgi:hypothetical protein